MSADILNGSSAENRYLEKLFSLPEVLAVPLEGVITFHTPRRIPIFLHHSQALPPLEDFQQTYHGLNNDGYQVAAANLERELGELKVMPRILARLIDSLNYSPYDKLPLRINLDHTVDDTSSYVPDIKLSHNIRNLNLLINPFETLNHKFPGTMGELLSLQFHRFMIGATPYPIRNPLASHSGEVITSPPFMNLAPHQLTPYDHLQPFTSSDRHTRT